ncbi:MAG: alpha-L-rhamnosidase C-terminal domain-containing protein, partial [Bacteroidales bacterium]|nr:alpha-L-rhamnosidase C-terminal domain-containing protein [Bacteroidales bacterium]
IVLEPHPGGGLTWAEGSTMTPYGPVSVRWEKTGDATYRYEVEAPKHTRVTLITSGKKSSFKGNGRKKVFWIADN